MVSRRRSDSDDIWRVIDVITRQRSLNWLRDLLGISRRATSVDNTHSASLAIALALPTRFYQSSSLSDEYWLTIRIIPLYSMYVSQAGISPTLMIQKSNGIFAYAGINCRPSSESVKTQNQLWQHHCLPSHICMRKWGKREKREISSRNLLLKLKISKRNQNGCFKIEKG